MRGDDLVLEVVVASHIVKEIIRFQDRTIEGVLGSPAAYSSVALGRLGAKVGLVTKIGTDLPENFLQPFVEANVDMRGVKIEGKDTTHSVLIYDKEGRKRILYPKKASPILFEDIPGEYLKSRIVFVCPMDFDVPLDTLETLSSKGVPLAADIGGYGGAHSKTHPDREEQKSRFYIQKLISHLHIVKVSMEDCEHLFGRNNQTPEDMVTLLVDLGADIATVTLAEEGAIVATKDSRFRAPAFPAKVIDCAGAGDVYCAGFLFEYLRTKDIYKSLLFALATASIMIEGTGGVVTKRMPTELEVRRRMQK